MAIPYLYTDYGEFLRREFPFKVQKISINAGFTCPNRNGEKAGADVLTATTRRLIRPIAVRRNDYGAVGRRQALFRAKVSGHEVSGLFPSLYEYVWRSG